MGFISLTRTSLSLVDAIVLLPAPPVRSFGTLRDTGKVKVKLFLCLTN
jgi:hypothetical protein